MACNICFLFLAVTRNHSGPLATTNSYWSASLVRGESFSFFLLHTAIQVKNIAKHPLSHTCKAEIGFFPHCFSHPTTTTTSYSLPKIASFCRQQSRSTLEHNIDFQAKSFELSSLPSLAIGGYMQRQYIKDVITSFVMVLPYSSFNIHSSSYEFSKLYRFCHNNIVSCIISYLIKK